MNDQKLIINCVKCNKSIKRYATIENICISCYNKAENINEVLLK